MISVIVPVYNTKVKLLNRCLNSILSQSYKQIQLIIVDDASSSLETKSLLQEFCKKDNRTLLITKEKNDGVDVARFTGIENSSGEWLSFVDSDDWLEKDALNKLISSVSEEVDVVVGSFKKVFYGLNKKTIYECKELENHFLMKDYFVSFFGYNKLPVTMWGSLYRNEMIKKVSMLPSRLRFGEDLVFNMQVFPYIRKMKIISDVVYNYNCVFPGVSSKYMDGWLDNAVKLFECKYRMLEKYPNIECERLQAYEMVNYLKTYVRMVLIYDEMNVARHQKIFQKCIESPIFEHLRILENVGYRNEKLVQNILNRDCENSWQRLEVCCKKGSSLKRKIKNFLLVFFNKCRCLV